MVDVALGLAGAAAAELGDHDLVVGDVDQQHRGQPPPQLGELRVERLGLRRRAREAVEDEAVAGLLGVDPLGDHADDHLVGDQVTASMYSLALFPSSVSSRTAPRRMSPVA